MLLIVRLRHHHRAFPFVSRVYRSGSELEIIELFGEQTCRGSCGIVCAKWKCDEPRHADANFAIVNRDE